MPIANFPILSFEQANPWMTGAKVGQDLFSGMIKNIFAPQATMADILNKQAQSSMFGGEAQKAVQEANYRQMLTNMQRNLLKAYGLDVDNGQAQTQPQQQMQQPTLGSYAQPQGQGEMGSVTLNRQQQQKLNEIIGSQQGMQNAGQGVSGGTIATPEQAQKMGYIPQAGQQPTLGQTLQSQVQPQGQGTALGPNLSTAWVNANRMLKGQLPIEQELALKQREAEIGAYGKGLEKGTTTEIEQYKDDLNNAQKSASDAVQMKNLIKNFSDAYDKSTLIGPTKGFIPSSLEQARGKIKQSSYLATAPFHKDFSPEQQADNAAQNMQAALLSMFKGGKITNYELGFTGGLKLNRSLTPQTKTMIGDWLNAKSDRLAEEPQFLNAAKNTGVDVQTAKTLWNIYNNQRQVYDFTDRKTNERYQGSWRDYLTPEAINAVKTGQEFIPQNVTKYDLRYLTPSQIAMIHQSKR